MRSVFQTPRGEMAVVVGRGRVISARRVAQFSRMVDVELAEVATPGQRGLKATVEDATADGFRELFDGGIAAMVLKHRLDEFSWRVEVIRRMGVDSTIPIDRLAEKDVFRRVLVLKPEPVAEGTTDAEARVLPWFDDEVAR